jgi:GTP-binding protein YchF
MKIGIIGLPGSGKSTIFHALTRISVQGEQKDKDRIGTVRVPEPRLDDLNVVYKPKKFVYAQVTYFLPTLPTHVQKHLYDQNICAKIRDFDALIHVIRNFSAPGLPDSEPKGDFEKLNQELMLNDLIAIEKRLEGLDLDKKRGKKINEEEFSLLIQCQSALEDNKPLRNISHLARAQLLRGYAFVSAKPVLVLFNNNDEDDQTREIFEDASSMECAAIRGKLEQELAQMPEAEAEAFLAEFNLLSPAKDRIIKRSYRLLDLISFFTVLSDEARAWTIRQGTVALDAAGEIHSDMKKGFIRAQVLSYKALMAAGSHQAAKKHGHVRLEGKNYMIADGDIIQFRFNV